MVDDIEEKKLQDNLSKIKNTIVVLSGKGGVGKSTVSTNIALSLANKGYKTGLLDVDIHGPSVPTLLNLEGSEIVLENEKLVPIKYNDNLEVMSVGFMIENSDTPVIWRGPMKMNCIRQMIADVAWNDLDYLVVDCPPGTGDEPLSVLQLLGKITGTVIVTTPQKVSVVDVRKSVNFCKQLNTPIMGIVENMSGFICPECKKYIEIFKTGGGESMAKDMEIPFLGKIPMEIENMQAGDNGQPIVESNPNSESAKQINNIVDKITNGKRRNTNMRVAIPTAQGKLCQHFGHCEVFTFCDVDESTKQVTKMEEIVPPEHVPGIIPPWVAKQGATLVLAGGMGARAQELFQEQGIKVVAGCPSITPEEVINSYLNDTLVLGANTCDH